MNQLFQYLGTLPLSVNLKLFHQFPTILASLSCEHLLHRQKMIDLARKYRQDLENAHSDHSEEISFNQINIHPTFLDHYLVKLELTYLDPEIQLRSPLTKLHVSQASDQNMSFTFEQSLNIVGNRQLFNLTNLSSL